MLLQQWVALDEELFSDCFNKDEQCNSPICVGCVSGAKCPPDIIRFITSARVHDPTAMLLLVCPHIAMRASHKICIILHIPSLMGRNIGTFVG